MFDARGVRIYLNDALDGLQALADDSVDVAIADPPYGAYSKHPSKLIAEHGLKGFGGEWTATNEKWDQIEPSEHLDMALSWISQLKRTVKPTGSIWIHSTYHNSGFVNVACQILGLEIINEVVWYKRNAFPNLRGKRLTASHETLLWVHTGYSKRSYTFNYESLKAAEYPEDSIKKKDRQLRTVWDIPSNKKRSELIHGKHPTQKPERLIQRMLDVSAPSEGTVLSPFLGSGTDLVVAMRNGLSGIGFDTDPSHVELAARRLAAEDRALCNNQMPEYERSTRE